MPRPWGEEGDLQSWGGTDHADAASPWGSRAIKGGAKNYATVVRRPAGGSDIAESSRG